LDNEQHTILLKTKRSTNVAQSADVLFAALGGISPIGYRF
jgi:hypothetical protein